MRPLPPSALADQRAAFTPDLDGLGAWARATFIDDDGALTNEAHAHLAEADIGWLWTNVVNEHRGRRIVGEAKLIQPEQPRWGKAMADWQLRQWFGWLPDFLIIIDADYAAQADDAAFCALVEHELYHCAHATDAFGMPRFRRDGSPIFAMRGHDVEEFVGVVERYGAVDPGVRAMVAAAQRPPLMAASRIGFACGTCHLRSVA